MAAYSALSNPSPTSPPISTNVMSYTVGRLPYTAVPLGGGRWQARNVYPLMNGRWALTVQVQDGGSAGRGRLLRRFVYFVPLQGAMRLLSAGSSRAR